MHFPASNGWTLTALTAAGALLVMLALRAGAARAAAAASPDVAITPVPRTEGECRRRHADFNRQAQAGGYRVLFLGDSITQGWGEAGRAVWERQLAPLKAAQFGVSGDRTEHLLWRLRNGNLDGAGRPDVVVLLIGTNNTGHRMDPPAAIIAGVGAILDTLRARLPQTKILLLAIFPRGAQPDDRMRLNNNAVNAELAEFGRREGVTFLDLNSVFLAPDGALRKNLMPDFLHPNAEGYEAWAAALLPKLRELLGHS